MMNRWPGDTRGVCTLIVGLGSLGLGGVVSVGWGAGVVVSSGVGVVVGLLIGGRSTELMPVALTSAEPPSPITAPRHPPTMANAITKRQIRRRRTSSSRVGGGGGDSRVVGTRRPD